MPIYEPHDDARISELGDPTKDLIARLGIIGVAVSPESSTSSATFASPPASSSRQSSLTALPSTPD